MTSECPDFYVWIPLNLGPYVWMAANDVVSHASKTGQADMINGWCIVHYMCSHN